MKKSKSIARLPLDNFSTVPKKYEPSKLEIERRNRIRASLFAYAYEFENNILISDEEFDKLCLKIDPTIKTGKKKLDDFFANEFDSSTGMWIRKHPELKKIKQLYHRIIEYKKANNIK